jgi:hypothetical protein
MPFPWALILRQAPTLLTAAEALLASSRRGAAATPAAGDAQAVRQRIEALEAHQQANAELVKQLTEQVQALAQAAEAGARQVRLALVLAGSGVGLGAVAILIALLR